MTLSSRGSDPPVVKYQVIIRPMTIRAKVNTISAFLIILVNFMINNISNNAKRVVRVLITLALATILIISQTACTSQQTAKVSKTEECLDTTCEISVYNMNKSQANKVLTKAFDKINHMEDLMSRTVKGSDVYKINHAGGKYVKVSNETLEVIKLAINMSKASNGKFDITLGKISEMWNFNGDNPKVPKDSDIKSALACVGYQNIQIDGNKVRLKNTGAHMDLGGVAKGYIADQVTDVLESNDVDSAIINLGGNVVAIGKKSSAKKFVIGVERPYSDRTEIVGSVEAEDKTLVTSGIYERFYEEDGVKYHHVLDPATGYPAKTDLEAVTIVADKGNSGFCDAMSTACLILGEKDAKAFVAKMQKTYPKKHIEASFINSDDDISTTDGMNLKLTDSSK